MSDKIVGNFVLNFDLTSCCQAYIGLGMAEYVDGLVNYVSYASSIEVNAEVLTSAESWGTLRWLLEKNDDLLLILTVSEPDTNGNDDVLYDMLTARNDMPANRVLYKLGYRQDDFRSLAITGGSSLLHFGIKSRDAGQIIWSHNTDTWDLLDTAIKGTSSLNEDIFEE